MIKIDEIEQFEKESLPQIKHQYWQLNSQTFPKEMNSFVVALKEKFADVFGKLGDIVQKKDCRVGKITIFQSSPKLILPLKNRNISTPIHKRGMIPPKYQNLGLLWHNQT